MCQEGTRVVLPISLTLHHLCIYRARYAPIPSHFHLQLLFTNNLGVFIYRIYRIYCLYSGLELKEVKRQIRNAVSRSSENA